jgi:hypothetical protein
MFGEEVNIVGMETKCIIWPSRSLDNVEAERKELKEVRK